MIACASLLNDFPLFLLQCYVWIGCKSGCRTDVWTGRTGLISYGLKSSAECLEDHGTVPDIDMDEGESSAFKQRARALQFDCQAESYLGS